jgi:2-dehydropantoate 2-reductase
MSVHCRILAITVPATNRDAANHQRHGVEADHIVGDLIRRVSETGAPSGGMPLLRLAYDHLKAYEAGQRQST